jgi:hypothetical protein
MMRPPGQTGGLFVSEFVSERGHSGAVWSAIWDSNKRFPAQLRVAESGKGRIVSRSMSGSVWAARSGLDFCSAADGPEPEATARAEKGRTTAGDSGIL